MEHALFEFDNTIITVILIISLFMMLSLAVYVHIKSYGSSIAFWFNGTLAILCIWTFGYMLRRVSPSLFVTNLILSIELISVVFVGPFIYMFTRAYSGLKNSGYVYWYIFCGISSVLSALILTNGIHHLIFQVSENQQYTASWFYYVILFYLGVCLIYGTHHFVYGLIYRSAYWRQQLAFVILAVAIPVVVNVMQDLFWSDIDIHFSTISLPITTILLVIAVLKYQFLDILPIVLTDVVESVDDGFLVVNLDGMLEDYSVAFLNRFIPVHECKNLDDVIRAFEEITDNRVALTNLAYSLNVKRDHYVSGELKLTELPGGTTLQYTSKAINDVYNVKIATIITFHDITELQKLYTALDEKKSELMLAKERLENHLSTVQMLTVETERNRLMAEVHDTLGHSMTEVLALLEKCDMVLGEQQWEDDKAEAVLIETIDRSREGLAQIRASVSKFKKMGVSK